MQRLLRLKISTVLDQGKDKVQRITGLGGDVIEHGNETESESSEEHEVVKALVQTPAVRGLSNYQLARDRVRRPIVDTIKLNNYTQFSFALLAYEVVNVEEPQCYHDALEDKDWKKWNRAMQEEMDSLIKNGTWLLVDKPEGQKVIGCRWLFKLKPKYQVLNQ